MSDEGDLKPGDVAPISCRDCRGDLEIESLEIHHSGDTWPGYTTECRTCGERWLYSDFSNAEPIRLGPRAPARQPARTAVRQIWTRRHLSDQDDILVTVTEVSSGIFEIDADRGGFQRERARQTDSLEAAKAAGDALVRGATFGHLCTTDCSEWKRVK